MKILLTNDDGIHAHGVLALHNALVHAGHKVTVVAPFTEQSAVSQSITFLSPLRVKEYSCPSFTGQAVCGTPADCVKLAICCLMPEKPDLVVSGINIGANLGLDVMYSGTVSAAIEASFMGLPSIAFSHDSFTHCDLTDVAGHAATLVSRIEWGTIPPQRVLNVNYPHCAIQETKGVKVCTQSTATWDDNYEQRKDPRGNAYWWMNLSNTPHDTAPKADRTLISQKYITITPLHVNFTDSLLIQQLQHLEKI